MEASMMSSDLSASSPVAARSQETLRQRLQALIEGARRRWTYSIFWQSSSDYSGANVLGWGDGYYLGEEEEHGEGKFKASTCTAAEQEHRKRVLRELNSLISGSSTGTVDDAIDEEVTDTEWFFLLSMTQSFINGSGLPGQAFRNSSPLWVAGRDRLASSMCEHERQGQGLGLQTMVCLPLTNGVVELGSTELIMQNPDDDLMNKVLVLFDCNDGIEASKGENHPSSPRISVPTSRSRL